MRIHSRARRDFRIGGIWCLSSSPRGGGIFSCVAALALLISGCASPLPDFASHPQKPWLVRIAAVGDTNGYNILRDDPDQEDPLQAVRDLLRAQDIFIFNFEGVLRFNEPARGTCRNFPGQSLFSSPPRIADFLRPARVAIATLANNHILDCGEPGIQETVRELSRRGILIVGAGGNLAQACKPANVEVNGVKLAVLAYLAMEPDWFSAGPDRPGAASWEGCGGERQLSELSATGSVVLVALHLHLGRGWTETPLPAHVALVQRVLAAGADVVIGHGPHVPQGVLQRHNGLGLLSLGNFLFRPDYPMPEKAHRSVLAQIDIARDRLRLAGAQST